ncbi:MAG: GPR endopeptidase [Ruminococcaceae bacterium]|nr:GPR endopeptidase [Oscillospiraceae bacterium]
MQNVRTDLAIEMHEMLMEAADELSGVTVRQEQKDNVHISRISIESLAAQRKMGKPIGHYITVEFQGVNIAEGEDYEALCRVVAKELSGLLSLKEKSNVLVVGLGNQNITPDALGPQVVSKLMVTRHLLEYIPDQIDEGIRPVCAISPGVLGTTGMETGEIVRGVTDKIRPEAVVVIDALAARSMDRISTTIQICDTGISPGAGVGNKRKALDKSTLGVPVIAIGVPTVIDAATITADTLKLAADTEKAKTDSKLYEALSDLDLDEQYEILKNALPDTLAGFMVTPKEVDLLIERVSKVVANGINLALHKNITFSDIDAYIS